MIRIVAAALSAVAAAFSIVGLTAIFPATKLAIVVMGITLEAAKIVAAVWLRSNWSQASWPIRAYLVGAVVVLMVITSAGVYGFLAKAHVDAAIPQLDASGEASIANAQLEAQRQSVEALRLQAASAPRKERYALTTKLQAAQVAVAQSNVRKVRLGVEAERAGADFGPLRFIAAAIGQSLDSTVRLFMGLLVVVFDPLAIVLWIAATGRPQPKVSAEQWGALGRRLQLLKKVV